MKKTNVVLSKGMAAATLETNNGIVKAISRSQPVKRTASGNKYGLNPSKPGEYPKIVTADLRRSIGWKMIKAVNSPDTGIVYTTSKYAPDLEMGGRSFLRRWPKENLIKIGSAFKVGAGS